MCGKAQHDGHPLRVSKPFHLWTKVRLVNATFYRDTAIAMWCPLLRIPCKNVKIFEIKMQNCKVEI